MTPKEQYEARKAARIAARRIHPQQSSKDDEMFDLFDRFVTAAERIADALEFRNNARL